MKWIASVLYLSVLFMAACQSDEVLPTLIPTIPPPTTPAPSNTPTPTLTPTPTPPTIPAEFAANTEEQARVRIVHAMLNGADVDVYIEARAIALRLQPGLFTNSVGIEAGEYIVRIQEAGNSLHQVDPIIQGVVTINPGAASVLVFTGVPQTPALSQFQENLEPIDGKQGRIQFINAVPRGPAINLLRNGQEFGTGIPFGQISQPALVESGDFALTAQTVDGALINYPAFVSARYSYTYVLLGQADDLENAEFIEFRSSVPGISTLRVVNGASEIGGIDVRINDVLHSNDLRYAAASERQQFETGQKAVAVFSAGQNPEAAPALAELSFNTNPDDDVTLIIVGEADSLRVIRHDEDFSPVAPGDFSITFMNALPIGQRVRVEMLGEEEALERIPDLSYAQVSPRTTITADSHDFYWSIYENDTQGATLETATNVAFERGRSYLYLMTGQQDEQPVIVSERIEEDEMVAILAAGPTATPLPPTNVRMINLIETGNPVDVILNDVVAASNLQIAQASDTLSLLETSQTLVVRLSGDVTDIVSIEFDFDIPGDYNIYIVGRSADNANVYIVYNGSSSWELDNQALIRMYNTSFGTDAVFGLRYGNSADAPFIPTPDPTTEAEIGLFRGVIPSNAKNLLQSVEVESATSFRTLPIGQYDFFITDAIDNTLATSLRNIDVQARKIYEIIAFQAENSPNVTAFIVSYDLPN